MKKRSTSSIELFPSSSKRRSNYFLFDSLKSSRLNLLYKNKNNKNNKIKIKPKSSIIQIKNLKKSNSIYRKVNTQNYNNKKHDTLEGAKIYLKLDKSEEIAKIV